jgi:hypothetical protein
MKKEYKLKSNPMKNIFFVLAICGFTTAMRANDLNVVVTNAGGPGTGSIDLTVTGGVAPFTYSWTGPSGYTATTEDISTLNGGTYNLTVTDLYCGVATLTVTVLDSATMQVHELTTPGSIAVYPNPGNSIITVSSGNNFNNAVFNLKNVTGQTILSQKNVNGTTFTFDISHQVKGIYFIEILNDEKLSRLKIVNQ